MAASNIQPFIDEIKEEETIVDSVTAWINGSQARNDAAVAAALALGATAAKALFGPSVRVTRDRGQLIDSPLAPVAALTLHPSAILRLRDHDEREDALAGLVDDLRLLASAASKR